MAQKRMFDKRVIETDKFMDLPMSAKALYFIAGMNADDKGFFQPKKLQRQYGFSEDDFKVLIAKQYFIVFDSGVMVVTDWNKNNWLDSRRIQETEYVDELKMLELINEKYELIDVAKQMLSQNRIEENSISSISNKNIYDFVQENFGRTLSSIEYEKIGKWQESFTDDMLEYAVELAVYSNVKTFRYLDGIIRNWASSGYKTLDEVKKTETKPKEKIEIPDYNWLEDNEE